MNDQKFGKFFVASLKRSAQNVGPLMRRKETLTQQLNAIESELTLIQNQIESYSAPIKEATGGFGIEDLITRVVEPTGKLDKNGKPVKVTKYVLKYPDTIIPEVSSESNIEEPVLNFED